MPTPPGTDVPGAGVRDLLDRAVGAGILTPEQAAAVAALAEQPATGGRRRVVLPEVLGYVGGTLAVAAALFLGAELWDQLGPWPRVLLLAAVGAACLVGGAALGDRTGAGGRLGGFLWAAAVVAVGATVGVGVDGLLAAPADTTALAATGVALVLAALLWWRRPTVLQHLAAFAAAVATLFAAIDELDHGRFSWAAPLLTALGVAWLAASALPVRSTSGRTGGIWRPAAPGWVLGALAVVAGPLFADHARGAWLVAGCVACAALVVLGVRARRPWVAAVGTGGVFLTVPLAVAELFAARIGPLVGILVVGLALVAAAVVLARRATR